MPVPEKVTVAAGTKFVPLTVTSRLVAPSPIDVGLTEVIVGGGLTVNPPTAVYLPPSGFVAVTSHGPAVAVDETVTLTVSDVALLRVTEFTVIPVPENDTVTPTAKFVPVIATLLVAP